MKKDKSLASAIKKEWDEDMIPIQEMLDNIFNKIELHSVSPGLRGRIFFMVCNHRYVWTKSLGAAEQSSVDSASLLYELSMPGSNIDTLDFKVVVPDNQPLWITIGIYTGEKKSDLDKKISSAFLLGIKQAFLVVLQVEAEHQKRNLLFEITKRLYSSIEIDQVLQIVYSSIATLYSNFEVHIWLSGDFETNVPVKKLFLGNEEDHNLKAYVGSVPRLYELEEDAAISVPLKGKQGTYGVLQFIHSSKEKLEQELETISLLGDTAGVALENAILYQQSKRLIFHLQLINETTHLLNQTLNLNENIECLITEIKRIFKPDEIHFLVYVKGQNKYQIIRSTVSYIQDQIIELSSCKLIKEVHEKKEAIFIPHIEKEDKYFCDAFAQELYSSVIIVPMIHNYLIHGLVITTHKEPYYFSFEDYNLLETLVHHASLAIVNSRLHQELNKMVITDTLTRLYARNYLDQEIILSLDRDSGGSFILMDIDNFKTINDTYGHQVGDDVLIQVANIIKSSIRETDIAARWGGEELAIYLPHGTLESATQVADRIRERVSRETSPRVTISIGISFWEKQDEQKSLDLLFQRADESLYRAKSGGKNQVIVNDTDSK